jgi:hypothetical protein
MVMWVAVMERRMGLGRGLMVRVGALTGMMVVFD